jgi:hypothetical protein
VVPAARRPGPTGLPTSPVYVQDLALWRPFIAVAGGWLWRRRRVRSPVGAGRELPGGCWAGSELQRFVGVASWHEDLAAAHRAAWSIGTSGGHSGGGCC